jgi:hypothetical protein
MAKKVDRSVISKAELAAELKLSRGRITQLIGEGLPTRPDGRLNRGEAVRWYRQNFPKGPLKTGPKPKVEGADASSPSTPRARGDNSESFMVARARKETALANMREIEAKRMSGEFVALADVQLRLQDLILAARKRLLSMGARLAPELAVATDAAKCQSLIDGEVRDALTELSEYDPAPPDGVGE